MKTYLITRTLRSHLQKTGTVPDDMHIDDVIEHAWGSDEPWVNAGSRDMNVECAPE